MFDIEVPDLREKFVLLLQKDLSKEMVEKILKNISKNKDIVQSFYKIEKFINMSSDIYEFIDVIVTKGYNINPGAMLPSIDAKPMYPEKYLGEFEGECDGMIQIHPNRIVYNIDNIDPCAATDGGYDDSFNYVSTQVSFENLFDVFPYTSKPQEEIIKDAIIQVLTYIIGYVEI